MIDRLPSDILQDVIFFTQTSRREHPQYVFQGTDRLTKELMSVSVLLRQKLLPSYVKSFSLARRNEYTTKPPKRAVMKAMLQNIKGAERFVQFLEIHSSQLAELDLFLGVRSLNVLGLMNDKPIDVSRLTFLDHLSFVLPSLILDEHSFDKITRLDLFIQSDIHSLSHLRLPRLQELNITTTRLLSLLKLHTFVSLLGRLDHLTSLALLRKSTQLHSRDSVASVHHEHVEIEQFFKALQDKPLSKLTIDSSIIRNSSDRFDFSRPLSSKHVGSNLDFILVEQSFMSLSSIEQKLTTLEFLINLPYTITSMKLIYGIQIELPHDTALKFFTDLFHPLINEEHGEINSIERYSPLKSIKSVYSMMAWNLTEDQRLQEFQYKGMDILSYDMNTGLFTPAYKRTNKSILRFSDNSILLMKNYKNVEEYDSSFWSIETISKDLEHFSRISRTLLGD